MSPERTEYYRAKQRRMAFYIVENEQDNKESPPTISAIIGLDKELEAVYSAARKPLLEKFPVINKHGLYCPSVPAQWKNNLEIIIPKAEFGPFIPRKKIDD